MNTWHVLAVLITALTVTLGPALVLAIAAATATLLGTHVAAVALKTGTGIVPAQKWWPGGSA